MRVNSGNVPCTRYTIVLLGDGRWTSRNVRSRASFRNVVSSSRRDRKCRSKMRRRRRPYLLRRPQSLPGKTNVVMNNNTKDCRRLHRQSAEDRGRLTTRQAHRGSQTRTPPPPPPPMSLTALRFCTSRRRTATRTKLATPSVMRAVTGKSGYDLTNTVAMARLPKVTGESDDRTKL